MRKLTYLQKLFTTLMVFGLIVSTLGYLSSCKKENNNDTTNAPKTLDKSKLYDKKWYNKGSTAMHDIKSSGVYGSSGNWKWINNSDTMEIVYFSGASAVLWKFYWSSDKEMACNIVGDNSEILYKDAPW